MRHVCLVDSQPFIASRLFIRRVELRPELTLATGEAPGDGTAIVSNFKPWLSNPKEVHRVSIPQPGGKFFHAEVTGEQCIRAFMRDLYRLMQAQRPPFTRETLLRISIPALKQAQDKKYQAAVRDAAEQAGFGRVEFFREPDAVFEYFHLLRGSIRPLPNRPLNILIIDFGGGTCNVSAVSTTQKGELWTRTLAVPVAAVAARAGGLYIDERLLNQGLGQTGIKFDASDDKQREARGHWIQRHMSAAEKLKRNVSQTRQPDQAILPLDGSLRPFASIDQIQLKLTPQALREIVTEHWSKGGIRDAVDEVLGQLHTKLARSARRSGVSEDPRALITHVILAGGSSQLPGFQDMVKDYFKPRQPVFEQVGAEYPFVVAAGMGLNVLATRGRLSDQRSSGAQPAAAEEPQEEVQFLSSFVDNLCFYWRPAQAPPDTPFKSYVLFMSDKDIWEHLDEPQSFTISVPTQGKGGAKKIRFEYQVAYEQDELAKTQLSPGRLNLNNHQYFEVPNSTGRAIIRFWLTGDSGHSPQLRFEVVDLDDNSGETRNRSKKFYVSLWPLRKDKDKDRSVESSTTAATPVGPQELRGGGLDVLCLDFGTATTTLMDLREEHSISVADFLAALPSGRESGQNDKSLALSEPGDPPPKPPNDEGSKAKGRDVKEPEVPRPPPEAPIAPAPTPPGEGAQAQPSGGATVRPEPGLGREKERSFRLAGELLPLPEPVPPKPLPGEAYRGNEREFISYVLDCARQRNLDFSQELVERAYLSLKVRPLIILAGPSGVGKSALARLLYESFGASEQRGDALRVAVEAHWTDGRFLFGRRDTHGFIATEFLQLVRRSTTHRDRIYHVMIDEMNLAHVEYYFAQWLSAMEGDGWIDLPELPTGDRRLQLPISEQGMPLIRFCGTINVDETTQILSDKVLDRANLIEMEVQPPPTKINVATQITPPSQPFHMPLDRLAEWRHIEGELPVPDEIREVWEVLAHAERTSYWESIEEDQQEAFRRRMRPCISFGRRILRDMVLFVAYAERLKGTLQRQDAIDYQIMQRVLPKLRGDARLAPVLDALDRCLKKHGLTRSQARLERMRAQLDHDQFVTFWS